MDKHFEKKDKLINIVMLAVLFFYPLRHIFHGVDLWDTGYNYANFTYIENMDSMWYFSTYLANIVGNVLTKLPLGDTYVGLNLYTGLTVSVLAVLGYLFSVKVVGIPKGIAFVGEFIAVCLSWCPTALLYNYLTYLLFSVAVVFLYLALVEEGKYTRLYFILAGICLGLNIFVRFSNLAQAAMILAVWAMAIIRREKLGKVVSQTLTCLGGYLVGVGVGFIMVSVTDNGLDYINGIVRLMSMPSEASDYTVYSMIYSQVHYYLINLRWVACLMGLVVLGMLIYKVIPQVYKRLSLILYVGCIAVLITLFYKLGMFSFDYHNLYSVFQWAGFLLVGTHLIGIVVILGKNFSLKEKLLCGLNMLVILLTPLGSNNHLFSAMNNVYLAAPISVWFLWRLVKWLPEAVFVKKFSFSCMPVKALICAVVGFLLYQSFWMSHNYVFIETTGGKERTTFVQDSDVLRWVKTDEEKAAQLSEISRFAVENGLKGKEVLLYGDVPAISFYLEMPFVLSPWPDLASYNLAVMTEEMAELQGDIDEKGRACPVIILSKDVELYGAEEPKVQLIEEMVEKYQYKVTFENERFILFMTDTEI